MIISNNFKLLPCTILQGVGAQILTKLHQMNVVTLYDLLMHLPLRYENRTQIVLIGNVKEGQKVLIEGIISENSYPKSGKTKLLCVLRDTSRVLQLRFFHITQRTKNLLIPGARLMCFGDVRNGPSGLEMVHPEWQVLQSWEHYPLEQYLTPVYPTVANLSQKIWRRLIGQVFDLWQNAANLPELLPDDCLRLNNLPSLYEALLFLHRPPATAPIDLLLAKQHPAQQRLYFEELVAYRLSLLAWSELKQKYHAPAMLEVGAFEQDLERNLPYQLTAAQQKVLQEIRQDLASKVPMLRLVQGDVGSGKTIVAALAALRVVTNNYQVVIMAPTELLAEQHYRWFEEWFARFNIKNVLLTGRLTSKARNLICAAISSGNAQIVLGTHAVLQDAVMFARLGLVVIDEQQRFGVEQRELLGAKGATSNQVPHQLVMTATPIPRTLAMSIYADLDLSIIDELPSGRQVIQTQIVSNKRRAEVIAKVANACRAGRQAYWVCPIIAESEVLACQAAEELARTLQQQLLQLRVGLLHGRMKVQDKEKIMRYFADGALDVLVATTVIEVGVDVPKASLMIIENAERLGLGQLHQLRGRVGRGDVASYCVLLYQEPLSAIAVQRLAVIRNNHDGFKIAEYDLKLRGPGDLLGLRQSGGIKFHLVELARDYYLLPAVVNAARNLNINRPELVTDLIERWDFKLIATSNKFNIDMMGN